MIREMKRNLASQVGSLDLRPGAGPAGPERVSLGDFPLFPHFCSTFLYHYQITQRESLTFP